MTIEQLTTNFLNHLQKRNTDAGNPQSREWLDQQAKDFKNAMEYAQGQIAGALPNIDQLILGIHLRCSPETYRIAKNSPYALIMTHEQCGTLRKIRTFNLKNVPLLDDKNEQDLNYLRSENIRKLIDTRLKRINIDPSTLSAKQKEQAMNGQPAWPSANDSLQIIAYIETHLGKQESYYFLCAYYKENYLRPTLNLNDPKIVMFKNYFKKEIDRLSATLNLKFDESTTQLTSEERKVYEKVYALHPDAKNIENLFTAYTQNLATQIRGLDTQNQEKVADFCAESIIQYMSIHPFYDANYRTIGIFTNATLSHFGYEYIDFNDPQLKKSFNISFNHDVPDREAAVVALNSRLVKKQDALLRVMLTKYKSTTIDQAIRGMAANGKHEDLSSTLQQYPDKIDVADQTPDKGLTPLHWAVKNKHSLCISTLVALGARCDIPDKNGKTAMDYAQGDEAMINLLSGKANGGGNNKTKVILS